MKYSLACFDVDGTLLDHVVFSWQLFHDYFKTDRAIRDNAKADFERGAISYEEWALHDIGLWIKKGVRKKDFIAAMNQSGVCLMPKAKETLLALKKKGVKLAIVSGTLDIMLKTTFPEYRQIFDHIYLSQLHFDEQGNLIGCTPTSFDMAQKANALLHICELESVPIESAVFVGDHKNDLEIAKAAGFSIAFDAKDKALKDIADVTIDNKDLSLILSYFN